MTESIAVSSNAASSANTSGVNSASAAAKKKSSPSKVAKSSTKSPKKKSGPANHPKYSEMIKKALTALNDRGGSSKHAILKYIMANYHIDQANSNNHLRYALKAGLKSGTLKQAKGIGAAGSFKLGAEKKKSASGKSKTAAKKPKTGTKKPKKAATSSSSASGAKTAASPKKTKTFAISKTSWFEISKESKINWHKKS